MKIVTNLTWPEKLALLNAHAPSDDDACELLGVSQDELITARSLETAGSIVACNDLDTESYKAIFVTSTTNPRKPQSTPSITRDGSSGHLPALSATKKTTTSVSKKRGRKGNNIATAFASIPTQPVSIEHFARTHKVSVAVLRQSKRFDTTGAGAVNVKRDKASGELRICRVVVAD